MHITTDVGYIALLTMLVIVPAAAVGAAVFDRILWRRRDGLLHKPLSPTNAFPVIPAATAAPLQVLSVETEDHSAQ